MRSLTIPSETLDAQPVDCRGCQHRVDVPGVDQVVCLAYLAVFTSTVRDACQEFEPRDRSPAAGGTPPAP